MNDSCAICLQIINKNNSCITECNHGFCLTCIVKHFKYNNSCPICRKALIDNNTSTPINDNGIDVDSIINVVYTEEQRSGISQYLNSFIKDVYDKQHFMQIMRDMSFAVGVTVAEMQSREIIYNDEYDDDDSLDSF